MLLTTTSTQAGLIEIFSTHTRGNITLSIEGNALCLTDHTGGTDQLRVWDNFGTGVTPMAQLGFVGNWDTSTILSVPLQDDPLLPTTRLDSLFGGVGLGISGNTLREVVVIDRYGFAYVIDIDSAETIGGTVPEPATIVLCCLMTPSLLICRFRNTTT